VSFSHETCANPSYSCLALCVQ